MRILGVDPGKRGGFAIIDGHGACIAIGMFPLFKNGDVDYQGLFNIMKEQADLFTGYVFIEKPTAMPKQSSVSTATSFKGYGMLIGGFKIAYESENLTEIRPQQWKKMLKEEGFETKGKQGSFDFCEKHWPHVSLIPAGKRVKQDGLADSLCIAEFGRRSLL